MPLTQIWILSLIFLAASIISVIAGSTSLITVPVMLAFGIDPQIAIATNMFGLTLMSLGGTLPFLGKGIIDTRRLPGLISFTLIGSILGALLLLVMPARTLPLLISIAMVTIALLSFLKPKAGLVATTEALPAIAVWGGYFATFILGIYGGLFSGGYVTLLTAAYVLLFRMTWLQAIATTKLINIFSSGVATVVFAHQGLINYSLGLILGMAMLIGGVIGGQLSLQLSQLWLQRIYLTVIGILAAVTFRKAQPQS